MRDHGTWRFMARLGTPWAVRCSSMANLIAPHRIPWNTTGRSIGHHDVSWHVMAPHGNFDGTLEEVVCLMCAVATSMGCRANFHGVPWQVSWKSSWDAMGYTRDFSWNFLGGFLMASCGMLGDPMTCRGTFYGTSHDVSWRSMGYSMACFTAFHGCP